MGRSSSQEAATLKRQGHFPCEAEIARRLSQSEERWRQLARTLESQHPDFPKVDPLMKGRYWPAVEAFFLRRSGVVTVAAYADLGGREQENLNAL